jgi:hypothetical protein
VGHILALATREWLSRAHCVAQIFHDHGILNGSVQLLGYQIAGSSSRPLPNWLLMKTDEIADLVLLGQISQGGRPTASGKHLKWDLLFIRVRPAADASS